MRHEHTQQKTCPLCGEAVDRLIYPFHRAEEEAVLQRIRERHPHWAGAQGACPRCIDYYHVEMLREEGVVPEEGPHFPIRTADDYWVPPTPLRMGADPAFRGRGVTICMIDSGFYPHPDLVRPRTRVRHWLDVTAPRRGKPYFREPRPGSWHGTMTSVVCAGNGYSSRGLYRAIAPEADLVLLKVENDEGKISTGQITRALLWAVEHRQKYNIRVVNLSLGDDLPLSYKESSVDQAAEEARQAGIVVVAAAGNDRSQPLKPPANSPAVIAVGGINDHNTLGFSRISTYPSSYGHTVDGLLKPELIAPAIWIAAPILPGTVQFKEAGALFKILRTPQRAFKKVVRSQLRAARLPESLMKESSESEIRTRVLKRISHGKYISPSYQHVDGTSFAAPIITSIIAQMLEANPRLPPAAVQEILVTTAQKLPNIPATEQGYGLVDARAAVALAQKEIHALPGDKMRSPQIDAGRGLGAATGFAGGVWLDTGKDCGGRQRGHSPGRMRAAFSHRATEVTEKYEGIKMPGKSLSLNHKKLSRRIWQEPQRFFHNSFLCVLCELCGKNS